MAGPRLLASTAVVVVAVFLCLPATPRAASTTRVGNRQTTAGEGLQQQQQRQQRSVMLSPCTSPAGMEASQLIQEMGSQLSTGQFIRPANNSQSISIPAEELPKILSIVSNPLENNSCPSSPSNNHSAPLSRRSTCPYTFNTLQLPDGYVPRTLQMARCLCQRCLENGVNRCELVFSPVSVLTPVGCLNGMQKYEEQLLEIGVACVCAAVELQPSTVG